MALTVRPATSPADHQACKHLIVGYAKEFETDLGPQDLFEEVHFLMEKYGPPEGALLVGEVNGEVRGCVAFEPLDVPGCRMKRMVVDPEARGKGLGRALCEGIIQAARDAGYPRIVLDTTEAMVAARALYEDMGFRVVDPDWNSPCRDPVFMQLDL